MKLRKDSADRGAGSGCTARLVRFLVDSDGVAFMVYGRSTGKTSHLNSIFRSTSYTSFRIDERDDKNVSR